MFKNPESNTFANSNTNIQPVDPNDKVISDGNNQVKDILIRLYNDNPWLADEKVFLEGPKIGKKTYYLGEYAAIMSKKQNQISPSIKSRVDKNANRLGDRIVSEDIIVKTVNPKRFQRALSFDDSMSGLGMGSQKGRRGILKHEFDKLQGARGLGNDNRRLERELKLIRRAF
ncbi:hypothetical protein Plhal703r1_c61g0165431 [Plasmopara halstedii]